MLSQSEFEETVMWSAIGLAEMSVEEGDRPFGCVIVQGQRIVATGMGTGTLADPTRHSEMQAIQRASKYTGGLLTGCTLISTAECCPMCAGAIAHSKISRVVFGSYRADLPELFRAKIHNLEAILSETHPVPEVVGGLLRDQCVALFSDELKRMKALLDA